MQVSEPCDTRALAAAVALHAVGGSTAALAVDAAGICGRGVRPPRPDAEHARCGDAFADAEHALAGSFAEHARAVSLRVAETGHAREIS